MLCAVYQAHGLAHHPLPLSAAVCGSRRAGFLQLGQAFGPQTPVLRDPLLLVDSDMYTACHMVQFGQYGHTAATLQ